MHTPKRTLLTLLVALALAAGTLGPGAAPARAAGPAASVTNSVADGGSWGAWLSGLATRWAALRSVLGAAPADGRSAKLTAREGVTVDPNGESERKECGDCPLLQPQEGVTADPDG